MVTDEELRKVMADIICRSCSSGVCNRQRSTLVRLKECSELAIQSDNGLSVILPILRAHEAEKVEKKNRRIEELEACVKQCRTSIGNLKRHFPEEVEEARKERDNYWAQHEKEAVEALTIAETFMDDANAKHATAKELCIYCHSSKWNGRGITHEFWCPLTRVRQSASKPEVK